MKRREGGRGSQPGSLSLLPVSGCLWRRLRSARSSFPLRRLLPLYNRRHPLVLRRTAPGIRPPPPACASAPSFLPSGSPPGFPAAAGLSLPVPAPSPHGAPEEAPRGGGGERSPKGRAGERQRKMAAAAAHARPAGRHKARLAAAGGNGARLAWRKWPSGAEPAAGGGGPARAGGEAAAMAGGRPLPPLPGRVVLPPGAPSLPAA